MVAFKLTIVLLVIFTCYSFISRPIITPFVPPSTGAVGSFGWTACSAPPACCSSLYIAFGRGERGGAGGENPQPNHHRHLGSLVMYILS